MEKIMKKSMSFATAALVAAMFTAAAAYAADNAAPPQAQQPQVGAAPAPGETGRREGGAFRERKMEAQQHIKAMQERLQTISACVDAAEDLDGLRKCGPAGMGARMGGGMMNQMGGGDGGPQGGPPPEGGPQGGPPQGGPQGGPPPANAK